MLITLPAKKKDNMKFKFDHTQDFQLDAINAIADIFSGQPREEDLAFTFTGEIKGGLGKMGLTELGFGNQLTLDDDAIFQNVKSIQLSHGLRRADQPMQHGKNFTIEMETGTGKTYVYLRTMFEMNQRYGFKKFIVVVPSVAIREGVDTSVKMMQDDLLNLYNQPPFRHFIYDSSRLSDLRSFATGNDLQLMIINIQAFDKAKNVIYQNNDRLSGRQPIEFIQATRPIVILDEPQNMEGAKAQEAIFALKPLCTLRYSATHKELYNLMFSLDPVQAYQRRLVKRILVSSVTSENDRSQAWLKVEEVRNIKGKIDCKLSFLKKDKKGVSAQKAVFKQHDDLWVKSGEYSVYQNGWRITEINSRPGMEFVRTPYRDGC
jgi:type III restriction enzyme